MDSAIRNLYFSLGLVCCLCHSKEIIHENDQYSVSDIQKIYQEIESYELEEKMASNYETKKEIADKMDKTEDYPFRNVSLPWEARVDDLVSRLTLEEITLQVQTHTLKHLKHRFSIISYKLHLICVPENTIIFLQVARSGRTAWAPAISRLDINPYRVYPR